MPASCRCAGNNCRRKNVRNPHRCCNGRHLRSAFLTTKNYFVIKEYNFSDLYVLFVGHLSDRMTSPLPFETKWSASTQLRSADVEKMQQHLTALDLYHDKLDGRAGMQTRAALGAYQKRAGLKLDCWPSDAVLHSMQTR